MKLGLYRNIDTSIQYIMILRLTVRYRYARSKCQCLNNKTYTRSEQILLLKTGAISKASTWWRQSPLRKKWRGSAEIITNQAKLAGISSCALCAGIAGCITILRLRLLENFAADIEMVSVQSLNSEHSDTDMVLVSYRQVLSDTHP